MSQIGEQHLRYNLRKWKKGDFDIISDISEFFTLVQLMVTLGNVNNNISVLGYWIFESNNERALHMTQESLDLVCYRSICEVDYITKYILLRC